jgi:hypothetical protein
MSRPEGRCGRSAHRTLGQRTIVLEYQRGCRDTRKRPSVAELLLLPRSLHLPVAVVEGSLTQNLNEIGVRLWA